MNFGPSPFSETRAYAIQGPQMGAIRRPPSLPREQSTPQGCPGFARVDRLRGRVPTGLREKMEEEKTRTIFRRSGQFPSLRGDR